MRIPVAWCGPGVVWRYRCIWRYRCNGSVALVPSRARTTFNNSARGGRVARGSCAIREAASHNP
jgi:hypothetical protein